MGLLDKWLAAETKLGNSQADALRLLNAACGTKYKSNWIVQQRHSGQGLERTPTSVRRFMMEKVLRERLAPLGVTDGRAIRRFLDDLT